MRRDRDQEQDQEGTGQAGGAHPQDAHPDHRRGPAIHRQPRCPRDGKVPAPVSFLSTAAWPTALRTLPCFAG